MFLDLWMVFVLAGAFGSCAFFSSMSGHKQGAIDILISLEKEKIIRIHDDGSISQYKSLIKKKSKAK